jgi:hypothetical protein
VPVEVMTHWTSFGDPPRAACSVLPTGQVVGDAADGVVPTKDVATPMPETAARMRANDMVIVRSRYLDECMSFIRRTVTTSS